MGLTGRVPPTMARTGANNRATTTGTTHLPAQPYTTHMIQHYGRKRELEQAQCLLICERDVAGLTRSQKTSANPEAPIKSPDTGNRAAVDSAPITRHALPHKADWANWNKGDVLQGSWEQQGIRMRHHHTLPRRKRYEQKAIGAFPVGIQRLQPVVYAHMKRGTGG